MFVARKRAKPKFSCFLRFSANSYNRRCEKWSDINSTTPFDSFI